MFGFLLWKTHLRFVGYAKATPATQSTIASAVFCAKVGVQRPAEKQEVEAEARGGGDKRRKAADDEIYQKLAVLDAQRLYLLYHPYLSSLPQIREMMYLGLPFISS